MGHEDFIIRRMTREELHLAIDWAAIEGWNPGPNLRLFRKVMRSLGTPMIGFGGGGV